MLGCKRCPLKTHDGFKTGHYITLDKVMPETVELIKRLGILVRTDADAVVFQGLDMDEIGMLLDARDWLKEKSNGD